MMKLYYIIKSEVTYLMDGMIMTVQILHIVTSEVTDITTDRLYVGEIIRESTILISSLVKTFPRSKPNLVTCTEIDRVS